MFKSLNITIYCKGAAFVGDGSDDTANVETLIGDEIQRILNDKDFLPEGGVLLDTNGNQCGVYAWQDIPQTREEVVDRAIELLREKLGAEVVAVFEVGSDTD